MPVQIGGHLRGAVARQIGGACDVDLGDLADPAGAEARVGKRAHPQRQIDLLAHQIDRSVTDADIDQNARPVGKKAR